ncbi:MAG: hypothetical protein WDO69_35320 [Pseudomonadota bacterium]
MALSALLLTACPGTLAHPEHFLLAVAGASGAGGGGSAAASGGDAATPVEAGSEAGAEAGAGPDLGPCGDVVTRIFIPSCGGTGCHGAVGPQQDLDLVSPGVASRVVGVPGTGTGCVSTLADPTNPEASLIYQKLSPTPPCGSPMPLARPALSDEDVACVLAWIAAQ